jgi:deoxyadenosine/deoxycytidine kinase
VTGKFIAFIGLPGAGKSTVCASLATLVGGVALQEPQDWPPAVTDSSTANGFTALNWFRAMRVPMYYQAMREREQGRIAILDTFYDKISHQIIGAKGMDWFLKPNDPYFDIYTEIARRDWAILPNPDVVVSFELREPVWRHFLASRGRSFDDNWGVSDNFLVQNHFLAAAELLSDTFDLPLLRFTQEISSPDIAATRLLSELRTAGLLD